MRTAVVGSFSAGGSSNNRPRFDILARLVLGAAAKTRPFLRGGLLKLRVLRNSMRPASTSHIPSPMQAPSHIPSPMQAPGHIPSPIQAPSPVPTNGASIFLTVWLIIGSKIPFDRFLQSLNVVFGIVEVNVLHTESIKRAFLANVEKDPGARSVTHKYADGAVRICGLVFGLGSFRIGGRVFGRGSAWYVSDIPSEASGEQGSGEITVYSPRDQPIAHMFEKDGCNNKCNSAVDGNNADDAVDGSTATAKVSEVTFFQRPTSRYDGYDKTIVQTTDVPTPKQQAILDRVQRSIEEETGPERGRVYFFYGPPGSGKTHMAEFLAILLNPENPMVIDHVPDEPGQSLNYVNDLGETAKGKFVVRFDEFDKRIIECLRMDAKGTVAIPHQHLNTEVTDKSSLHRMIDGVPRKYPKMVIVITSNQSAEEITEACGGDRSTFRDNRMEIIFLG